jgi:hypothetical protein
MSKKGKVSGKMKTKQEEACTQLKRYHNSPMFARRDDIRYLSVIFIGKDKL